MRETHFVTRACGELTAEGSVLPAEIDERYLPRARTAIARTVTVLVASAVLVSSSWAAAQPGAGAGPTSVTAPAAYVRNIYKYYVAYRLTLDAQEKAEKARQQFAPAKN